MGKIKQEKQREIEAARRAFKRYIEDREDEIIWELSIKLNLKEDTIKEYWYETL